MEKISIIEKLKIMTVKQRISYIWYYYKIHILSILVLFLLIISFTYSQLNNQDVYFNITYVGNPINADELSRVDNSLNKVILNGNTKKIINLNSIFIDDSSNNSNSQFTQKLMVQIAAREIDMAIVNKQFFEANFSSDIFLNLETLEGFSSLPISNKDVIKKEDSNGTLGTYGIAVKDLNLLNDINFSSNDNILVVISNSERLDRSLDILKVFLNKNI